MNGMVLQGRKLQHHLRMNLFSSASTGQSEILFFEKVDTHAVYWLQYREVALLQ